MAEKNELKIIKIQKHYRIRIVGKLFKQLNFESVNLSQYNFDQFSYLIQNKTILLVAQKIIKTISRLTIYPYNLLISHKEFLTIFLLSGYGSEILNINLKDQELLDNNSNNDHNKIINNPDQIIYDLSQEIVSFYQQLSNKSKLTLFDMRIFGKLLNNYHKTFNLWKKKDHQNLVKTLIISYYDIQNIIDLLFLNEPQPNEEEIEYISLCQQNQQDLKKKIISLNGLEDFNNYKPQNIQIERQLRDQVTQIMYQVFWNKLTEELDSVPPSYEQLMVILQEIQDIFCQMIPNRLDIQSEIKDNIDPQIIKNMLEHSVFDNSDLQKLCQYIINLIKRFQPPVMDQEVEIWEREMLSQFDENIVYSKFLVIFLKSVFNMLNSILIYSYQLIEEN